MKVIIEHLWKYLTDRDYRFSCRMKRLLIDLNRRYIKSYKQKDE